MRSIAAFTSHNRYLVLSSYQSLNTWPRLTENWSFTVTNHTFYGVKIGITVSLRVGFPSIALESIQTLYDLVTFIASLCVRWGRFGKKYMANFVIQASNVSLWIGLWENSAFYILFDTKMFAKGSNTLIIFGCFLPNSSMRLISDAQPNKIRFVWPKHGSTQTNIDF